MFVLVVVLALVVVLVLAVVGDVVVVVVVDGLAPAGHHRSIGGDLAPAGHHRMSSTPKITACSGAPLCPSRRGAWARATALFFP